VQPWMVYIQFAKLAKKEQKRLQKERKKQQEVKV